MKFDFFLPTQKKILIFDTVNSHLLKIYLKKKDLTELDTRRKRINIIIFCISLFRKFSNRLSYNYYINYIKFVKPKIIITYIDNNEFFFQLKKFFPSVIFLCIQNGTGITWEKKNIIKKNWLCDYFFCFSNAYKKIYEKRISGKVIVIGSFKNNIFIPQNKNNKRKNIITFISQYRKNNKNNYSREKMYLSEKKIINLLIPFCVKNKLKLYIAGAYIKRNQEEIDFFNKSVNIKNLLHSSVMKYSPRTNDFSSYRLIDKSQLVIYVDSALGLESFARNNKTISLSLRSAILKKSKLKFGWPLKLKDRGNYWINYFNEQQINIILKHNFKTKIQKWSKINREVKFLIKKDYGNKIFKKIIKSII